MVLVVLPLAEVDIEIFGLFLILAGVTIKFSAVVNEGWGGSPFLEGFLGCLVLYFTLCEQRIGIVFVDLIDKLLFKAL